MYRTFPAIKDSYITNRVIRGKPVLQGNTGGAGTIDIFKLYGVTQTGIVPNTEISRALIKFDMSVLATQLSSSNRSASDPTFNVQLKMSDVYGGQTTPSNFQLILYPLSQSFDEGAGRDVAFYRDIDSCNFLTASWNGGAISWFASGANSLGLLGSSNIDVISSGNLGAGIVQLGVTQSFPMGTEDLLMDVTTLVSATLAGLIPDCGWRLSLVSSQETDTQTRFVKRFASRTSADPLKHPQLIFRINDAISDNREQLTFDMSGSIFLFNHALGVGLKNLVSGSTLSPVTGSNCMLVRLETPVSGGIYSASFVASQVKSGTAFVPGTYTATIALPSSDPQLGPQLRASGSVTFNEYWVSSDGTVGFYTGSKGIVLKGQDTETYGTLPDQLTFSAMAQTDRYTTDQIGYFRIYCRKTSTFLNVRKLPQDSPSYVPAKVYYSVRDADTDNVIIPFDTAYNSTLVSSDSAGMSFSLYMDTLPIGGSYVIDLLVYESSIGMIYRAVSNRFSVLQSH